MTKTADFSNPPHRDPGSKEDDSTGLIRASRTMAFGTLASRGTGFLRTALVASVIGVAIGDAYNLANTLPNIVYELLLGGVLTSVVVPLLVAGRPPRGRRRRLCAETIDARSHRPGCRLDRGHHARPLDRPSLQPLWNGWPAEARDGSGHALCPVLLARRSSSTAWGPSWGPS